MLISGRVIMSFVMFAIFAGMVGIATTYPPEARFLPLVIGIPGVLLTLAQLAGDVAAQRRRPPVPAQRQHDDAGMPHGPIQRRELVMFAYFFGFLTVVLLFGYIVATPVLVFVYLRVHERESWRLSIGMAAGAGILLYLLFRQLLEFILFEGFLYRWFLG